MRILILNWRDTKNPNSGGAEISTHEHAKRWVEAGHKVTQFSSAIKGEKASEVIDGIFIVRKGNYYTVHIHAFFYYLISMRKQVDLVVDEFHFIPFFTPLYVFKKKLGFIHETAEEIWFKNRIFPFNIVGFFLEPFFFKLYKKVPFMTVSESTKRDLIKFGISSRNISVIFNGVEVVNSQCSKSNSATIIYLGRLAKDKGTMDAIIAFAKIKKSFPDAKLWIVGKEENEGFLRDLKTKAAELHVNQNITFYGFVSEKRKFDLLRKAWILIHPSIKEGWGLTVIEAASQGTPTVAYDTSGLRDSILDKRTGLLVKEKNPDRLADKVLLFMRDMVLYNRLSKEAELWSRQFDWKDAAEKSLALIEDIV